MPLVQVLLSIDDPKTPTKKLFRQQASRIGNTAGAPIRQPHELISSSNSRPSSAAVISLQGTVRFWLHMVGLGTGAKGMVCKGMSWRTYTAALSISLRLAYNR